MVLHEATQIAPGATPGELDPVLHPRILAFLNEAIRPEDLVYKSRRRRTRTGTTPTPATHRNTAGTGR